MKSLNMISLMGNLGKNPEIRYTATGEPVVSFSLATNNHFKNKEGSWTTETQWHQITVFDELATKLQKGQTVYLEGALKYGKYTNKPGQEVKTSYIVANLVQLCDAKAKNTESEQQTPQSKIGDQK